VEPGQIWKLGRHTLICGSIYDAGYVDADAVITDPPYGIEGQPLKSALDAISRRIDIRKLPF
jgi:DNA modification methylase